MQAVSLTATASGQHMQTRWALYVACLSPLCLWHLSLPCQLHLLSVASNSAPALVMSAPPDLTSTRFCCELKQFKTCEHLCFLLSKFQMQQKHLHVSRTDSNAHRQHRNVSQRYDAIYCCAWCRSTPTQDQRQASES